MKKVLMVCNIPYQVIIATWLKITCYSGDEVDIIISDHMVEGDKIATNMEKTGVFSSVFYVKTKKLNRNVSNVVLLFLQSFMFNIIPKLLLSFYFDLNKQYDVLCVANLTFFAKLLFQVSVNFNRNKEMKFFLFEDGISTYSKTCEKNYHVCKKGYTDKLLSRKAIYNHLEGIYAFEPDAFLWEPNAPIIPIRKINCKYMHFIDMINIIFDYENIQDLYDRKYIFMEESYYGDGYEIDDVQILEQIAKLVGKNNIIVKNHPRNPENRFAKLGYKTNDNCSVPWEVILMNQQMQDKILLTMASASIISSIRLFDEEIQAFSFYPCLKIRPSILEGDLWNAIESFYKKYTPSVMVCTDIQSFKDKLNDLE